MATRTEILIPDIGDFTDVEIIEVLAAPGDHVEKEQGLLTLETDKATMDIPAPAAGKIVEMSVSVGDRVSMGDLAAIMEIGEDGIELAVPHESAPKAAAPAVVDTPSAAVTAPAVEAAPAPVASAPEQVTVPDIGDFANVDVIDVLVAPGDRVEAEQGLITLETDKATMDIPAPRAGTVESVQVKVGDKVSVGDQVLVLLADQAAAPATAARTAPAAAPAAVPAAPAPAAPASQPAPASGREKVDEAGFANAYAGPSVRKFAREVGVDLIRVKGTGRKGRITHEDVKQYIKARMSEKAAPGAPSLPRVPEVDFARFGPVEVRPLGRIRKISGPRLQASWLNAPHVTQFDDADITDMDAMRKALKDSAARKGIRLTPLAFIMRACAMALQEFPQFNTSLDATGENLVYKQYINIGFAADTPNGLVVPVVHDADKKDLFELAAELGELSAAAREGKLTAAQMQGGCFTISSLGGIGGTAFTPIVNAPEVAILGVSRSRMAPVWDGKGFMPRLMLPLSLSYDHRVIDGADAARFTTYLSEAMANVSRLVQAIP